MVLGTVLGTVGKRGARRRGLSGQLVGGAELSVRVQREPR